MSQSKNEQIKESIKATRERHSGMICRVFELKVTKGKLSKTKKDALDAMFREAKWLRNSELAKGDTSLLDRNAKTAQVKVGNSFETRDLLHLGSQVRQDIVDKIKSEIKGLATKKAKGDKVGALKFKSYCNSVPLRQYGTTYRIDFEKNLVFIQGMSRKPLKVRGLKQIPKDAEFANARLVRKPSGYYIHVTTYCPASDAKASFGSVGIDFGISSNLTLSTGEKINIKVPETKAVKLSSRRLNRSLKKSGGIKGKNHNKRKTSLRAAYEKQNNIKRDAANKICSYILNSFDFIAIQNEMISNWHKGLFGKEVQHSCMGLIKGKLKTSSKTHVVPRSFPSTQVCPICGNNTKHPLSKRTYECSFCGYTHPDRDIKAAESILSAAINSFCGAQNV